MAKILRSYRWPLLASVSLAILIGLIVALNPIGGSTTGDHNPCSVTSNDGIMGEVPLPTRKQFGYWKVENGDRHGFPPVRTCRLYGAPFPIPRFSLTSNYQLIAKETYPPSSSYLVLLIIVLMPLLVTIAWKIARVLAHRLTTLYPR